MILQGNKAFAEKIAEKLTAETDTQNNGYPIDDSFFRALLDHDDATEDLLRSIINQSDRARELEVKEALVEAGLEKIEQENRKLQQLKNDLEKKMKLYTQEEEKKIKELVKFYQSMEPEQATKILRNIDNKLVIIILRKMLPKSAAAILGLMPSDKAQKLTQEIAGFEE